MRVAVATTESGLATDYGRTISGCFLEKPAQVFTLFCNGKADGGHFNAKPRRCKAAKASLCIFVPSQLGVEFGLSTISLSTTVLRCF